MEEIPERKCLSGVGVHTATKIVGWISFVCVVVDLFFQIKMQIFPLISVISFIFYSLLLYGVHNKKVGLYVAYLIFQGILFTLGIAVITELVKAYLDQISMENWIKAISIVAISVSVVICYFYFQFLVPFRSYKLLEYEKKHGSRTLVSNDPVDTLNWETLTMPAMLVREILSTPAMLNWKTLTSPATLAQETLPVTQTRGIPSMPATQTWEIPSTPAMLVRETLTAPAMLTRQTLTVPAALTRQTLTDPAMLNWETLTAPAMLTRETLTSPATLTRETLTAPATQAREIPSMPVTQTREVAPVPSAPPKREV